MKKKYYLTMAKKSVVVWYFDEKEKRYFEETVIPFKTDEAAHEFYLAAKKRALNFYLG